MKKYFLSFALMAACTFAFTQSNLLSSVNESRYDKQKLGMYVLGTWALGNIAVASIRMNQTTGEDKAFQQMQIGWSLINMTIATWGYFGTQNTDYLTWDTSQSVHEHYKMQKILLFNAGLDVGYMLGGAYLMERGKREVKNAERLRGFGRSILLQGAFLFVFDVSLHTFLSSDNAKLKPILNQSSIGFAPNEVHLRIALSKP